MSLLGHWRSRSLSASRPHNAPASSQAHLAATQAFLASRASQSNLSASAAATALRTLSPPPIPVEQVQTKRMLQRQSSNSSNGSSSRGRSRGGLQRQNSSGSMTERTFRTPSPGKSPSRPDTSDIPPVPILAENYPQPPPIPARSQRRAVSLDSTTKPGSYTPLKKIAGRNAAVTRTEEPSNASKVAAKRSAQPLKTAQLERTDSKGSINFSYPRPMSPAVRSPADTNGDKALRSSMRNGIPANGSGNIPYDLARVADQPVKKKKKKVVKPAAEGSHLQSGGMGNKPTSIPLDSGTAVQTEAQTPAAQPIKKKKKAAAASGETSHFPPSPSSTQTGSDSDSTPEKIRDRRSARASGMLTKQPSIVREDWEGEQESKPSALESQQRAEQGLSPVGSPTASVQSKKPTIAANVSKKIDDPPNQSKTVTQPSVQPFLAPSAIPPGAAKSAAPSSTLQVIEETPPQRTLSISPSRATRFSDRLSSDMTAGRKHEPLPRSVSPAKPALKHPNAQQGLESNLSHVRTTSASPSEISELDVDGVPKRKKSARVSFETDPEIVGTSAEPVSPDTPILASPQNKDTTKKSWFGLTKSKQTGSTTENESEEGMGRTPQLPTFGSVRGKGRKAEGFTDDAVSQTQPIANISATSSEASYGSNIPTMDTSVSSDHAIGAILAHDATQSKVVGNPSSQQSNSPLPPEVTTVEGSGYHSDTESEEDTEVTGGPGPAIVDLKEPEPQPNPHSSIGVPEVSVQPPTPALELPHPVDQWSVQLPGGFPASSEQLANVSHARETQAAPVELDANPHTPTNTKVIDTTAPGIIPTTDLHEKTTDHEFDEKSSDNDSIYSDAAEDVADLDGDGFGSINAIVDSPVTSKDYEASSPPESPTTRLAQNKPPMLKTDSWDGTKARWSQIAEKSRQPDSPPGSSPLSAPNTPPAAQPKRKKKGALAAGTMATAAPVLGDQRNKKQAPVHTRNQPARNQATAANPRTGAPSPVLRSSFRDKPTSQADPAFRSSLRSGPQPSRATRSAVPQQAVPPRTTQTRAALQKKHIPSASPAAPVSRVPPMPPIADDSDSESSFRKARRKRGSRDGQYSMRRSMRSDGPTTQDQPTGFGGRGGVRSLSPEMRRPFVSPEDSKPFKRTMRGSADSGRLTLRSQSEQRKSSFFGMSRSPPPVPKRQQVSSPMRSRLVDSDDEKDAGPTTFRSRYAESSDEEEEPGQLSLRPVRGIPKAEDEGDSTDLEDSSDDEKRVTEPKPQTPAKLEIPAVSTPLSPGPSSPGSEKRRGFFGRFRSKKVKNQPDTDYFAARNTVIAPLAKNTDKDSVDASSPTKESDIGGSKLGFRSAAERDAVIAETRAKLEAAHARRPNSPLASGTLRSRPQAQRVQSESWPLAPRLPSESDNRPHTSHGPGQKNVSFSRSGVGDQGGNTGAFDKSNGNAVYGRSGKKKKFLKLRKAFGLVD